MSKQTSLGRRLRLGMVGGGQGAFIGAVHRIAARLDDRYELVAGALSSKPDVAAASAAELFIDSDRSYASFEDMAKQEAAREDGIDVCAIVTPNHLHFPAAMAMLDAGIHVICDKPLCMTVDEAEKIAAKVKETGLLFALTHNYTAYPMVREARQMVADGKLGNIRLVQVEYPQGWMATKVEDTDNKQANWRADPAKAGMGGALGDIGTHAHNLANFVSGMTPSELCADVDAIVEGRKLDDNVQILMRYENGARGMLWASQVAIGHENGLRLRIYGDKGGLEWAQEHPNHMHFRPLDGRPELLTRGGAGIGAEGLHGVRVPPGHPEGYLEGFANLYTDFADQLVAHLTNGKADAAAMLVPGVKEGLEGMKFVEAVVRSGRDGAVWVKM
ncbi:MAG: gfo/Idh/MocA family oxidoreductase [Thalassospira sp.]|uniref:Gfo/Idh/MocA family protein n=1 Tax=Thalassospira TaxID=168934 RepID=UPI00028739DD|nr:MULTISPECIES: Gfo/Idh/MocA family oxidoreductase [Thalassospira]EKF08922.1 oxidoreductase domain-containing protein [Thalassospira profundimaris WP0211]MBE70097.1 gfo/Idh/MocA family oxidoreductase [Thalassospira sp.]BDW94879.1 oxidoreductase [Thalassospira tepidiphila]|tara:strand:+ start:497 stop:1660 length:1164 start_codon:yes stop_codon:yes gene_type:complete